MGTDAEQTARPIPLCYSLCRPSGLVREVDESGIFLSASLMSERTEVDGRRTATEGGAVISLAFQWVNDRSAVFQTRLAGDGARLTPLSWAGGHLDIRHIGLFIFVK